MASALLDPQVWKLILDSMAEGVIAADENGRVIFYNSGAARLTGILESDANACDWARRGGVFRPDQQTPFPAEGLPMLRALHGEPCDEVEFYVRRGSEPGGLFLSAAGRPIKDASGATKGAVMVLRDITRRRLAEDEVRRSESFLNSVVENLPDMVFIKDAQDLRFVRFNKAGEELLGFSREELIGKNDYDFFPKEEADFFTGKDREVLHSGRLAVIPEEPIDTRLKGRRLLRTKKIPVMDASGKPAYLLGISDDITEEKARLGELKAANEELEAFNYSVSHDLRKPLSHISGYAELLLNHLGPRADEKSAHYLKIVVSSAQRMGYLIDDLLAFSRMGRIPLKSVPVDLGRLWEEAKAEQAEELKGRSVEWKLGPLPAVRGDPAMLRLVLSNLLSNSLKFTRPRKAAVIELGSLAGPAGEKVFFVRDNGVGFQPQEAGKLFTAFKRLHSAKDFEGSGIGLATVRRVIQRHGGRTWAEGRPGEGAVLYFSLPK